MRTCPVGCMAIHVRPEDLAGVGSIEWGCARAVLGVCGAALSQRGCVSSGAVRDSSMEDRADRCSTPQPRTRPRSSKLNPGAGTSTSTHPRRSSFSCRGSENSPPLLPFANITATSSSTIRSSEVADGSGSPARRTPPYARVLDRTLQSLSRRLSGVDALAAAEVLRAAHAKVAGELDSRRTRYSTLGAPPARCSPKGAESSRPGAAPDGRRTQARAAKFGIENLPHERSAAPRSMNPAQDLRAKIGYSAARRRPNSFVVAREFHAVVKPA